MARFMKSIVDFGSIFPSGAGGESGGARKRNEADVFQRLRNKEVQVSPLSGDGKDGDFVGLYAKRFGDALRNRWQRDFLLTRFLIADCGCQTFEFGDEACAAHGDPGMELKIRRREKANADKLKIPANQTRVAKKFLKVS
jgi:hypothetical protein